MEAIQSKKVTLKQILRDRWCSFLDANHSLVPWYAAYSVWKVINCREPDGLGYATFACPIHPSEFQRVPYSCKSRFCSVCAKVQIDKWVTNMNQLFPNCSYFHTTFTVPSQFRTLLFEKRALLNAVFSACTQTLISFCKERGFLPAITAVLHTFGSDLKRHVHIHCIISAGGLKHTGKQKRFTRETKRKKKKATKKISVIEDQPVWVNCHYFPYKMLQNRYQALLIEHLKKAVENNIKSAAPDPELLAFSIPSYKKSFFDDLKQVKSIEFIRKLIRHIPPHYFNAIRHYGILVSRMKTKFKQITDRLLPPPPTAAKTENWRERQTKFQKEDPLLCKICKKAMEFISTYRPNALGSVRESFQTLLT